MGRATKRRDMSRSAALPANRRLAGLEDFVQLDQGASSDGSVVEVRRVSAARATKVYSCPGCQQEIPIGTQHVVVVPPGSPDLRRHWHAPCWSMRDRRRPGH
ncbi:MAG TPA: hypothetical protein VME20_12505 [Acidimicrobiales bacterium]|nr:hypothetical protein [Acidimicrobiales bacterium]